MKCVLAMPFSMGVIVVMYLHLKIFFATLSVRESGYIRYLGFDKINELNAQKFY